MPIIYFIYNSAVLQALVATALAAAGAAAAEVAYVAVHGTGTPLGDPIEVGALAQALTAGGTKGALGAARREPAGDAAGRPAAMLGSVKACFGHTEGTAGITGEPSQSPYRAGLRATLFPTLLRGACSGLVQNCPLLCTCGSWGPYAGRLAQLCPVRCA